MSIAPRDAAARRDWGSDDSGTDILHVDMDSFFASVEIAEDPSLRGKPLIVGGRGNRGVVTAATYEVRGAGVHAGMPMSRARALAPHAIVVPGRKGTYSEYSRRVMDILQRVTPVLEKVSIDEAFLDVSGSHLRLGSSTAIAQEIRRMVREETGLPASVGIAVNKTVAKIASAHAKPDGWLLIPEDATVDFLHSLPVGALWGVGRRTGEVLAREGVDTIGDLAHLGKDRLRKLVGAASAYSLHELAWGIDRRPVQTRAREKSISTESTFDVNITSREKLEAFVLDAAHQCAKRLRAGGFVAWTVGIKMRDAKFATITRSVTLPEPTDVGRDVAAAARRLLDAETIPTGGVRLMGVKVEGLQARDDGVAVTLDHDVRPRAAETAMDQIAQRYGDEAVRPASLIENSAPND